MPIEIINENCNQEKKDTVNVFVAQPKWKESDWEEQKDLFFPENSQVQIDYINMYLEKSLEIDSDIVVFPELSILENHLVLIEEWAQINNKIVVAGSQYYIDKTSKMNISPIYINNKCIKKEKTIPASLEKSVLAEENLKVGNKFVKFKNSVCGTLCVFICAEYLDENTRHEVLKNHDIDVLVIIALQKNSVDYYKRMDLTVDESKNGLYVIYANNFIENISDGGSSVFALIDRSFTRTSNYSFKNQAYLIENEHNYFLATLDLKNKKNPVSKNTDTDPNISIKKGFIDISSNQSDKISFPEVCIKYNKQKMEHITKFSWEEKLEHITKSLHQNIEHKILKLEFQLNSNNPKNLKDEDIATALQEILFEIRQVYNYFVGDVSVHIKLKETIDNEDFLRTLYREPLTRDEGTGELFKVFNHTSISVLKNTKLRKSVINYAQIRVNSAYNEVLLDPTQNWLCTDLNKAEEKNLYHSTSFDWKTHYKSLAIFPITDRYSYDEEKKNMKGILIIDSKDTECFPPEITKQIGGLLAHRLNHIFSLTDVYKKYFSD